MKVWNIVVNVKRIVMQNGDYGNVYSLRKLWKEIQETLEERESKALCAMCTRIWLD